MFSSLTGLVHCGLLGIVYQFVCLGIGVVPVVYLALGFEIKGWGGDRWGVTAANVGLLGDPPGEGNNAPNPALVRVMIGGVVASRTGLWLFDLAVTQLVQESVDPLELGE